MSSGDEEVAGRMGRRQVWAWASTAVVVQIALVALILLVVVPSVQGRPDLSSSAQPSASASSAGPAPSTDELARIQDSIRSGSDDQLRPLIGVSADTPLAGGFAQQLKDLEIRFDQSSVRAVGSGWDVTAQDRAGKTWHVGLVRKSDGGLVIVYGEAEE